MHKGRWNLFSIPEKRHGDPSRFRVLKTAYTRVGKWRKKLYYDCLPSMPSNLSRDVVPTLGLIS